MTNKEMKEWVKTTWNKCQEEAWAMPTTPQPEREPQQEQKSEVLNGMA